MLDRNGKIFSNNVEKAKRAINSLQGKKQRMDTYYMKLSHITELSGVVSTFFGSYSIETLESVRKGVTETI